MSGLRIRAHIAIVSVVGLLATVLATTPSQAQTVITFSLDQLPFGAQVVGTTSPAQSVPIEPTPPATISIASAAITGTNTGDFAIAFDTCSGKTVGEGQPDGASCSVDVIFSPSATGHRVAALVITDAQENNHPIVLTGLGVAVHGAPLAWGRNSDNQVGDGTSTNRSSPTPVSNLSDVVEMEGGFFHSLAIGNGGRVYAWGQNSSGQLGLGGNGPSSAATPQLLSQPTGVSAVSAEGFQSLALDSAGEVWQWGSDFYTVNQATPKQIVLPDGVKAVAVAAGETHSLALGSDQHVYVWGSNCYGQIGDASSTGPSDCSTPVVRSSPVVVPGLSDVVEISAGEFYSVALRADGTVWSWGNNSRGQLADCGMTDSNVPVEAQDDCDSPGNLTGVVAIDAGSDHTLALLEGGSVQYAGAAGVGAGQMAFVPVPGLTGTVVGVSGGAQASFFHMANGTVKAWGDNRCGQLGLGVDHTCDTADTVASPTAVDALGKVESVSAGLSTNYAIVNQPLDLALGVSPTTSPAGFARIDEKDINLAGASLDPGTLEGSAGPGDAPLGKNPLGKNPLGKNPLGKNPLGKNPLGKNPLGKNPLGKNGLNLTDPPLRAVPVSSLIDHHLPDPPLLSSLPLSQPGGWQALLGTTAPDQSLTLNEAIDNPAWSTLKVTDIDWSRTRFADFSPAAWLLGELNPNDVTLPGGASWSPLLSSMGCLTPQDPASSTFVDLQWARCDLTLVPWDQIQLSDIAGLASSPLGRYKLDGILLSYTPLGDILAADVASIVDCTKLSGGSCGAHTLAEAQDADAIDHGADLSGLSSQFSAFGPTLTNMLPGMMDVTEYPYEGMTLTQLIRATTITPSQPTVQYHATMSVQCPSAVGTDVTLVLPSPRFRPVPGDATFVIDGGPPTPAGEPTEAGSHFTWTLPDAPCDDLQGLTPVALDVSAVPGPTTGIFTSSLLAGGSEIQDQAVLTVIDGTESGNTVASATPILPNVIYTGRIGDASDLDYYTIHTGDPRSVVAIYLSHLPVDEDLVMYGPSSPTLRSASLDLHPLGKNPLDDSGSCLPEDYVVQPQTLEDVPVVSDPSLAVRSFSTNRSQQEEVACTVVRATDGSGDLTVQVSGFNGAQSNQPYALRAVVVDPGPAPACTLPATGTGGTVNPMPASIASDTQTLILINSKRFGDIYGSTAENAVMSSLASLASATDGPTGPPIVKGAVIPVENDARVQAAYNALDVAPCSPSAANGVVQAINAFVDQLRSTYGLTQLKFIVLVGSDNVIPLGRVPDLTTLGNQIEYASNMRLNAGGTENPISAAFGQGYILSDDPYGSFAPIPWNGNALYIPDVSVGRLVETPTEIQDQIGQFTTSNGRLDPSTALVTGYDFTKDSAAAINATLASLAASTDSLISDTWASTDLVPKFGTDRLMAINGHFDHFRTQTANGDIVGTGDFLGQNPPLGSFLFTLGCNAGVPVPDVWFTSAPPGTTLDWGQSLSQRRGELLGNNGFGYGDDTTDAYSEQVVELVAQNLGPTMSVGQAVALAKGTYYGSLSAVGAYDIKALEEATFYGLPMYRVGSSGVIASASASAGPSALSLAVSTNTDPDTGLTVANVPLHPFVDPVTDRHTAPHGRGEYFTGPEVQVSQFRPIEPVSSTFGMSKAGTKLHDAIVTGLEVRDFTGFGPVIAVPTLDLSGHEPEPVVTNVVFPTDFVATSSALTILGRKDFMVVDGGRFTSDPGTSGLGTQRIHLSEDVRAYYSTSTDYTRPEYRSVNAFDLGAGSTAFAVDMQPNPSSSDRVVAVYVMYLPPGSGSDTFVFQPLVQSPTTPTHWTGAVSSDVSEYFVQAVDQNGNVGLSTFKGASGPIKESTTPPGGVHVSVTPGASNGWYADPVHVSITSDSGETFEASVDGGSFTPVTGPFTVGGDGAHTVDYRGTQGSRGTTVIPIDTAEPTFGPCPPVSQPILLNSGTRTLTIQAFDGGIGLDTTNSDLTRTLMTDVPGDIVVTFTAKDLLGKTAMKSCHYQISYQFSGFFPPVDNNLTNVAKAGQTVPVKWKITDASGVGIADSSSFVSLTSAAVTIGTCTSAPSDAVDTSATGSGLQYLGEGNWLFSWKTSPTFKGCRIMTVTLKDGTTHSATFQFKS